MKIQPVDTEARDKARRKRFLQILTLFVVASLTIVFTTMDGATIKHFLGLLGALVLGVLATLWKPWKV